MKYYSVRISSFRWDRQRLLSHAEIMRARADSSRCVFFLTTQLCLFLFPSSWGKYIKERYNKKKNIRWAYLSVLNSPWLLPLRHICARLLVRSVPFRQPMATILRGGLGLALSPSSGGEPGRERLCDEAREPRIKLTCIAWREKISKS
jgi:hypothetical protein